MHRTEGANNVNGMFTDGPPGTCVEADSLNAFQEEIANVIEAAGITLSDAAGDARTQLLTALRDSAFFGTAAIANGAVDATKVSWTQYYSYVTPSQLMSAEADGWASYIAISIAVPPGLYAVNCHAHFSQSIVSVPATMQMRVYADAAGDVLYAYTGVAWSGMLSDVGLNLGCGGALQATVSGDVRVHLKAYDDNFSVAKRIVMAWAKINLFRISD